LGCNRKKTKKLLVAFLVIIAFIGTITPPVIMAADDTIHVTFDPSGSVSLDVSPQNYFSLQFTSAAALDGNNDYIPSAGTTLDNSLASSGSETFKITIHLGPISTDHGWQTTTINFTGTAAS